MAEASPKKAAKVQPASEQFQATGRRKTAVVSVWLASGSGKISINSRDFEDYFPTPGMQQMALASLASVGARREFDIVARATGGGLVGQASAMRHAVARALLKVDPTNRSKLKPLGFLTRDPRAKERKKSGQPGARKRFQFSKR